MFADSLVDPLRVVCCLDPAIDRPQTPVAEYVQTRDPDLVRELPGRHANWCVLRPLTAAEFLTVDGAPTAALKLRMAFMYAVDAIENWYAPGMSLRGTRVVCDAEGREQRVFDDREYELVFRRCGGAFVYEIGSIAYDRAIAGNAWSGSAIYTLPQSSVQGLDLIARRLAAQSSKIAGIQSSVLQASDSLTTSSPISDADTGAPAPSGQGASGATSPTI